MRRFLSVVAVLISACVAADPPVTSSKSSKVCTIDDWDCGDSGGGGCLSGPLGWCNAFSDFSCGQYCSPDSVDLFGTLINWSYGSGDNPLGDTSASCSNFSCSIVLDIHQPHDCQDIDSCVLYPNGTTQCYQYRPTCH